MLSLTDYLLIKLNEECVELADAAVTLTENNNENSRSEFSDELNDILGVLSMFPHTAIYDDSKHHHEIGKTVFQQSLEIEESQNIDSDSLDSFINKMPQRIAIQALATAKMASKCLVFGIKETYVGSILHNTSRLYSEVDKLIILSQVLVNAADEINIDTTAQARKRAKMLKYLPISLAHQAINENCYNEFKIIVTHLNE